MMDDFKLGRFIIQGIGGHRALIIGSTQLSQDISERMILYPLLGYYYVGTLDDAPPEKFISI